MDIKDAKRKLTTIFSADVKGYSRLMGEDEEATVETITFYRKLMSDLIEGHNGRIVDAKGDNILAEFASVVKAVQCGVNIQKELKARNEDLPEKRRMEFRIGINMGDVIEDEGTIYGDGVNIAARLESLADGGGICISGNAYDQIGDKLPLGYEYLGEQSVKNIAKPVRVYRVLMEPEAAGKVIGEKKAAMRQWKMTAVSVLVVILIAVITWYFFLRQELPKIEAASVENMAYDLPEDPSIAVLPFNNLSGDKEQDWFIDGFTENIITALAKDRNMFVIASNSTFTYKGKPVKIKQVSEELGVRYVLEGSIQKIGKKLRINAQLIDAIKGHHIWAERYDREMKDIFNLQDEITLEIAKALQVKLMWGEGAGGRTKNLDAWGKFVEATSLWRGFNKDNLPKARKLLEEAIKLDPNYSAAWTLLSMTYGNEARRNISREQSRKRAIEFAKKAASLDETACGPYMSLLSIYSQAGKWDEANIAGKKSIALGPSEPSPYIWYGIFLRYAGRFEEAIEMLDKWRRLRPRGSSGLATYLHHKCVCLFQLGRYEAAIEIAEYVRKNLAKKGMPTYSLIINHVALGNMDKAKAYAKELLEINPKFNIDLDRKSANYRYLEHHEKQLDALRKAGIPEHPPKPKG